MVEKNKREYTTPMVELIEARVEKGFTGSSRGLGLNGESGEKTIESRSNGGNWGGGDAKWN